MANKEHLDVIKQGREAWNAWRKIHAMLRCDLSEADLRAFDLSKTNFSYANFSYANFNYATLSYTSFYGVDLSYALQLHLFTRS